MPSILSTLHQEGTSSDVLQDTRDHQGGSVPRGGGAGGGGDVML